MYVLPLLKKELALPASRIERDEVTGRPRRLERHSQERVSILIHKNKNSRLET